MNKSPVSCKPISMEERFVTAFVSALAAVVTLVCYFVINLVLASKSISGIPLVGIAFSKFGLPLVGLASAVGFVLGAERVASVFSFFWGTHPVWEHEWFQRVVAALVAIAVVAFAAHLLGASHAVP